MRNGWRASNEKGRFTLAVLNTVAVIDRVDDENEEGPVLPCIRAFRVSSQSGKTFQIGVAIKFNG